MAITPADFKTRFPEFAAVGDSRVQVFLDDSSIEVLESAWGSYYERGVYYLAAHLLAIATKTATGASGSVALATRKKVGEIEIQYSEMSDSAYMGSKDLMLSTVYGQEYLRLYELVCPFIPAVLVV